MQRGTASRNDDGVSFFSPAVVLIFDSQLRRGMLAPYAKPSGGYQSLGKDVIASTIFRKSVARKKF